jgi:hypothetical protein
LVGEYVRRFRDTHNKCYSLTIREKDLAELVFAGLTQVLKDKMEGRISLILTRFCSMHYPMRIGPRSKGPMANSRKRVARKNQR